MYLVTTLLKLEQSSEGAAPYDLASRNDYYCTLTSLPRQGLKLGSNYCLLLDYCLVRGKTLRQMTNSPWQVIPCISRV